MMKLLVNIATAFLTLVYWCLTLLPTHDRIVCLSRQSGDEPRDFVLIRNYAERNYPDYEVVSLAKALHSPIAYIPHMFRQLYYIATSRAVVLDSYCIVVGLLYKRIRVPVIQMWHGLGNMKKFGYSAIGEPEGHSAKVADVMHMHRGYTTVLISSLSFADDFAQGFGVDPSIMYEAPLPRTDLLIDEGVKTRERERIFELYPELRGKKTIVYAPTFRKVASDNEAEAMARLVGCVDFSRYNFVYMAHPVSTQRINDKRVLQGYDHSCNMLYVADYVISDYSTVIYEAGLLGVPVYLYTYDWESYSERRSLYIDIMHDVPTLATDDPQQIFNAIEHDDFDAEAYRAFVYRNVTLPEQGSCTERVVNHIFDLIEADEKA